MVRYGTMAWVPAHQAYVPGYSAAAAAWCLVRNLSHTMPDIFDLVSNRQCHYEHTEIEAEGAIEAGGGAAAGN